MQRCKESHQGSGRIFSEVDEDALTEVIKAGEGIFFKVAEDAVMNSDESVSLNDNHPGGSQSLACRSGT